MSLTAALRDLNQLNAFVRVAQRRSFTRAAVDLRSTPSLISRYMKELETALGFSLFNRSTHGLTLTDAGEGLYRHCLDMLARLDGYVVETRNLQKSPYGTLRVQVAADYAQHVLAPQLAQFTRRYPGLVVQLLVAGDAAPAADDGFDVIIALTKPALPGLTDVDLGTVRHVLCASPAYFRRCGRPRRPQDLRDHSCLVSPLATPKGWTFRSGARRIVVAVRGALASSSTAVLV